MEKTMDKIVQVAKARGFVKSAMSDSEQTKSSRILHRIMVLSLRHQLMAGQTSRW